MNAPTDLNPLICDAVADTLFTASCAVKFLARAAEDRTHEGTDSLSSSESAGEAFILNCIAAALDYAQGQHSAEGGEA
ncbi:hypothetical protein [Thauera sp. 63]|uniref:hypothetical protein n=1 Tax=Thauera sp. 63 TaxID=497321 RepID=UPI0002CEA8A0|nr:hypothetical protein [Thauera sp. 63]ENO78852.1 hypothetical protein C664_06513 [Thauera sp. 63]